VKGPPGKKVSTYALKKFRKEGQETITVNPQGKKVCGVSILENLMREVTGQETFREGISNGPIARES